MLFRSYLTCSSQYFVIQVLQKLCPHGVETGLLNTSRQMEHEKFSSDQLALAQAIPRRKSLCIEQYHYFCYSITAKVFKTYFKVVLLYSPCCCFCLSDYLLRVIFLPKERTAYTSGYFRFRFLNMPSSPLLP